MSNTISSLQQVWNFDEITDPALDYIKNYLFTSHVWRSPLFRFEWKVKTTEDGAEYHKLGGRIATRYGVKVEFWPTPDASKRGPRAADLLVNKSTVRRRNSDQQRGIDLQTAVKLRTSAEGNLNPAWVERLMGFPAGWTDI